jgi:hypothetical protein
MSFEEHLLNGIPQAEAADFFLRIRGKDKVAMNTATLTAVLDELPPAERAELMKAASAVMHDAPVPGQLKKANMGGPMPGSAMSLPAIGRGMNMSPAPPAPLPPTAMGQQAMKMGAADKSPEETGKERARTSVAAEFEREKHHKHENSGALLGRLAGAALGGGLMHHAGGGPIGTLGGVALGHHMGGAFGKEMGARSDRAEHEKHAAAFKLALDSMGLNAEGKGQQMGQQQPAGDALGTPQEAPVAAPAQGAVEARVPPAVQAWLEAQRAGDQAAEQGQAEFLRQKLDEARAEMSAAQEEAAALQEQQAAHDAQQAQIQQQVQESIQQAAQAQDQVLQEQQAAAAMRMAFQQLRGQVLQIASTDPPALSSDAAALSAASTQAGPSSGPGGEANAPERGPAGQAPSPGTPNTPAPLGDETVTDKDGLKPNEPTFGNAEPASANSTKEPQGDSARPPQKEVLSHYRPLALRRLLHS